MASNSERRRRLIVDKEVQSRIVLSVALPPAMALMVAAMLTGFFCVRLHNEALQADADLPSLVPLLVTIGLFCVVAVGFLIYAALRFSHRVAGPTYRILKTLEAARDGDRGVRAKLRDGDFLGDVAAGINEMLDELEGRSADAESESPATEAPTGTAR